MKFSISHIEGGDRAPRHKRLRQEYIMTPFTYPPIQRPYDSTGMAIAWLVGRTGDLIGRFSHDAPTGTARPPNAIILRGTAGARQSARNLHRPGVEKHGQQPGTVL